MTLLPAVGGLVIETVTERSGAEADLSRSCNGAVSEGCNGARPALAML